MIYLGLGSLCRGGDAAGMVGAAIHAKQKLEHNVQLS